MTTAVERYVELFQRYVGGELPLNMLQNKLYTLAKRVDLEDVDPLIAGLLEDLESEVDSYSRDVNNHKVYDDGELRYLIAAMLSEIRATLESDA